MAVDTALMMSLDQGFSTIPTLRLYGWEEPTLTAGYAQSYDDLKLTYLAQNKIPVTRRPTGGRALLHDDEVTYSVTVPSTSSHYGSLRDIYTFISVALKKTLADIGVCADADTGETGSRGVASCFATRTKHEITVEGRKVTGSAQRRLKNAAMQHGFISLSNDIERNLACIRWNNPTEIEKTRKRMGGINDFVNGPISPKTLEKALIRSFESLYDITFVNDGVTEEENGIAESLLHDLEIGLVAKT
ncbi:Lipoate-protein ligase A [hydrothermal vent metagenome]|uniref:Lipoate-protein ligase A n=1 Tax=hydrothermal vent metagenome TaxID=652676 RepID=A0A3B1CC12_9ZZZZ